MNPDSCPSSQSIAEPFVDVAQRRQASTRGKRALCQVLNMWRDIRSAKPGRSAIPRNRP